MNHVLLIDDDVELVGMFQEYLQQEGFSVTCVHDGVAGTREALAGKYAIAVLDVMMPHLNGIETLRRIRMKSRIPVLMPTASWAWNWAPTITSPNPARRAS
jgi:two-component system OmpR family response regulator